MRLPVNSANNLPLISVIVPVFNAQKTIHKCVDSILSQTYKNIEIILVDDGSKDESSAICDKYGEKYNNIKVYHQKNAGASVARNLGLEIAQGEYIGFVDSDDFISQDMYDVLYSMIIKYDVPVSACNVLLGKEKKNMPYYEKKLANDALWKYFYRVNGEQSNHAIWDKLFQKNAIKNIRFVAGKTTEDLLFNYEVYKATDAMVITNRTLYHGNFTLGSVTNQKLKKIDLSLLNIWDYIVEQEQNGKYCEYAIFNRKRADFTLYVKGCRFGYEPEMKPYMKEWKKNIKQFYPEFKKSKVLDFKRRLILEIIKRF